MAIDRRVVDSFVGNRITGDRTRIGWIGDLISQCLHSLQLVEVVVMSWLLEQPGYAIACGSLGAAAFGGAWLRTGNQRWLVVAATVVVGSGALVVLERWVETDREQVHSVLLTVVDAIERSDVDELLRHVHSDATDVQSDVKQHKGTITFETVDIKSNLVIRVDQHADVAIAEFNVMLVFQLRRERLRRTLARYVQVWFRRDGGRWRIDRYAHWHFTDGLRKRRPRMPAAIRTRGHAGRRNGDDVSLS